jgi:membrane protein DedA with SNARE-associated domain
MPGPDLAPLGSVTTYAVVIGFVFGFGFVFVFVFVECGLPVGLFLPGDTLLLAGYLAASVPVLEHAGIPVAAVAVRAPRLWAC